MGHDVFTIEGQKLVRTFPLYNEGDTNQKPTGGKRKLVYGLYPGEAMWQLKIDKLETVSECPSTNEKICSSSRKAIIVTAGIHCSISRITI